MVGAFGSVLAVAGCNGDDVQAVAPELTSDQAKDPELVEGEKIFEATCATCHGADGGGGVGFKLSEGDVAKRYPNIEYQITVVTDGRNLMLPFRGKLTADEIQSVVRYQREVL